MATIPLACEPVIVEFVSLNPTRPPTLLPAPLTLPVAMEPTTLPRLVPIRPPATAMSNCDKPFALEVTAPKACPFVMAAPALFQPMRPPMETPNPVAFTALLALRLESEALLSPIRPPACAKPPVLTMPVALLELAIWPVELLEPTRPPIKASADDTPVPLTSPDALENAIEPEFSPTRPPAEPAPPLTAPVAIEPVMPPALRPARPPRMMCSVACAFAVRLIAPVAIAFS